MSPKLRNFIATAALSLIGLSAFAQKAPPPPDTRVPLPGLIAPIDQHIIILVIAGIIMGLLYMRKRNKGQVNIQS